MNRKAISILVPLFVIAVMIFVVGMVLHVINLSPPSDFVPIGERQEAILNMYFERHAIHTYARQAAKIALQEAIDEDPLNIDEGLEDRFRLHMIRYPSAQLSVQYTASRQADTFTLTSNRDVMLATQASRVLADATDSQVTFVSGGVFNTWPVLRDENNPAAFTSLFGFRTIAPPSSQAHPAIDLRAAANTPVFSLESGRVIAVGGTRGDKFAYIQHPGGWMCGYFHIEPEVSVGDTVQQRDRIGVVSPLTRDPHLDLRCTNTDQRWTSEFVQSIGANTARTQDAPRDQALHFIRTDQYWIDPFCLFAPELQEEMVQQEIASQAAGSMRSGMFFRTGNHDVSSFTPEKIRETLFMLCDFYRDNQIIEGTRSADAGANALIGVIIAYTIDELETTRLVLRPDDPPTKYGITIHTLRAFLDDDSLTVQDLNNTPREIAEQIYYEEYYRGWGFDLLPADLLPIVFDAGVLEGQPRAAIHLRGVLEDLGFSQTGSRNAAVREETADVVREAIQLHGLDEVVSMYATRRINHLQTLPNWDGNRCGWTRRVESFRPQSRAGEAHREPGCDRTFYRVFRDGAVAGESWRAISARLQQNNAELSYRFPIETSVTLSPEQRFYVDQVTALHNRLYFCDPLQASCVDMVLSTQQIQGFSVCTDFDRELEDAVSRCQEAFANNDPCACALPLPEEELVFGAANVTLAGRNIPVFWTSGAGEEVPNIEFFIAEDSAEDPDTPHPTMTFSSGRLRMPVPTTIFDPFAEPFVFIDGFDRYIWATASQQGDTTVITLAPHSTLNRCDVRVQRNICRDYQGRHQEFDVELEVRPTPPPTPSLPLPGPGSFLPDPLAGIS